MDKIKVLVVDDSSLMRNLLSRMIAAQPDMVVVGAAADAMVAGDMVRELSPQVMTLDIEMPRVSGLEFLEKLMQKRPMPVVMVSTLTQSGAEATMRALELGAIDFIPKPRLDMRTGQKSVAEYALEITDKIRAASKAKPRVPRPPAAPAPATSSPPALTLVSPRPATPAAAPAAAATPGGGALARLVHRGEGASDRLILIGASTGGTEAIRELLSGLPADMPPILITQHMPSGFTKSFAERLNKYCKLAVKEAEDGERVLPGHAYIAPGSHHLLLKRNGGGFVTSLSDGPPVNRHRPSVEVLFRSGAEVAASQIVGVMLTGMGRDGAQAMREMRDAGSYNIVQDEASSVVFGMPREAIAAGAANEVAPLCEIAGRIVGQLLKGQARAARA
jgi:two-component system chemotaxis response regulator CheB